MAETYPRAPITEAVLAFRFSARAAQGDLQRAIDKLQKFYPISDTQTETKIQVEADTGKSSVERRWFGARLSSTDRTEVALCRPAEFACSKLAPYTNWSDLSARARRDWDLLRRALGAIPISRIGLRYLNRLDIPDKPEGT
ncbi:MAG TPA: TIGR04255 family protein, partial [Pseudolabrys sp.]|nr:TIGR04255 family protein [Pseudolabrys sp.]